MFDLMHRFDIAIYDPQWQLRFPKINIILYRNNLEGIPMDPLLSERIAI
jgi:hypothetical protein